MRPRRRQTETDAEIETATEIDTGTEKKTENKNETEKETETEIETETERHRRRKQRRTQTQTQTDGRTKAQTIIQKRNQTGKRDSQLYPRTGSIFKTRNLFHYCKFSNLSHLMHFLQSGILETIIILV